MIVMKFGGSSVADAERIRGAAEIVRARLERKPAVVVSALAATFLLISGAFYFRRMEDSFADVI